MNETLKKIEEEYQTKIKSELEPAKKSLETNLANALKQFQDIIHYDKNYNVKELLKPFGIEPTEKKKPREKKITFKIAGVLTEKGLTEKEVIEALPKLDKEKIIASLNSIKSKVKPGKRDSFIYKSNKYFPKK